MNRAIATTSVATLLAVAALAGCGGSSSSSVYGSISSAYHTQFIQGCTSSGPSKALCDCIFTKLTSGQGYNTAAKLKALDSNTTRLEQVVATDTIQCKS